MRAFAGGALVLHNGNVDGSVHIPRRSHFGRARVRCDEAMTEMDAATDRSALVPGAHRLIRAVDSSEGPFSGALVSHGDGVAVSVDTAALTGWDGWAFSGAAHVCGVIDLRRRVDGQDALLPWCTQRVETFIGRRRIADVPLSAGEIGTLVASLLRGARELTDGSETAAGDWWLTGDGRPLFVHGDGGDARARTASLVERVVGHTNDRATIRVLEEIVAALRDRRHHADDDMRWEEHLFTVAAPRALRLDVFAPEKAADLPSRRPTHPEADVSRSSFRRTRGFSERSRIRLMLDALRTELRERSEGLVSRLSRGGKEEEPARNRTPARSEGERRVPGVRRSPKRSRRRPLILAGSLAAVVLIVGLMWPEGSEPDPASAAQGTRESAAPDRSTAADTTTVPETDPVATLSAPPPDAEDALGVVPVLLNAVAACAETRAESCPDALADGLGVPVDGLVAQGVGASTVTLVDDYGDVAVVKLAPVDADSTAREQMLVLERREQKWLVRDIYDVAHQPE